MSKRLSRRRLIVGEWPRDSFFEPEPFIPVRLEDVAFIKDKLAPPEYQYPQPETVQVEAPLPKAPVAPVQVQDVAGTEPVAIIETDNTNLSSYITLAQYQVPEGREFHISEVSVAPDSVAILHGRYRIVVGNWFQTEKKLETAWTFPWNMKAKLKAGQRITIQHRSIDGSQIRSSASIVGGEKEA